MLSELRTNDLALDSNVRKALRKVKADIDLINRRLCVIETCKHCKHTCNR